MFSNVVMGVDADLFENALTQARLVAGVRVDSELSAEDLQELVETFKDLPRTSRPPCIPSSKSPTASPSSRTIRSFSCALPSRPSLAVG